MKVLAFTTIIAAVAAQTSSSATESASASTITSTNFFVGGLAKANATAGYAASLYVDPCATGTDPGTLYVLRCTDAALCATTGEPIYNHVDSTHQVQTIITSSDGVSAVSLADCAMTLSASSATCTYWYSTSVSNNGTSTTSFTSTISAAYTQLSVTAYDAPTSCTPLSERIRPTGLAAVATAHAVYKILIAPAAAFAAVAML